MTATSASITWRVRRRPQWAPQSSTAKKEDELNLSDTLYSSLIMRDSQPIARDYMRQDLSSSRRKEPTSTERYINPGICCSFPLVRTQVANCYRPGFDLPLAPALAGGGTCLALCTVPRGVHEADHAGYRGLLRSSQDTDREHHDPKTSSGQYNPPRAAREPRSETGVRAAMRQPASLRPARTLGSTGSYAIFAGVASDHIPALRLEPLALPQEGQNDVVAWAAWGRLS